jgi:hypothetical protein
MGTLRPGEIDAEPPERATTVIICGSDRCLLNWVCYALATRWDPRFHWTSVRLNEESVDPDDPLARGDIPEQRRAALYPEELRPSEEQANLSLRAMPGVLRPDDPPQSLLRFVEFFRLPAQTQALIGATDPRGRVPVYVLSNAHRLVALYPRSKVGPALRAIMSSGATVIASWADAPPGGRFEFDIVLHLDGTSRREWPQARIRCEKGGSTGAWQAGSAYRLADLPFLARALEKGLPTDVAR